jgi:hypothetical protein
VEIQSVSHFAIPRSPEFRQLPTGKGWRFLTTWGVKGVAIFDHCLIETPVSISWIWVSGRRSRDRNPGGVATRKMGVWGKVYLPPASCDIVVCRRHMTISTLVKVVRREKGVDMHAPKRLQLGMKRVMRKGRGLGSKRAVRHLVWTSPTHTRDRDQADKLRSRVAILLDDPRAPRAHLVQSEQIATQLLFVPEEDLQDVPTSMAGFAPAATKKGQKVDPGVFEKVVERERQKRSFYYCEKFKRKRASKGVIDTYCSIPPWWGKILNREMTAGRLSPSELQNSLVSLGNAAMKTLAQRTNYEPVYMAVHPESEANMHIHFGLGVVDSKNRVLGRSATGKRGKKGLRHAGDCNVALLRLQALAPSAYLNKIAMKAEQGDFDDVAVSRVIDQRLGMLFPNLREEAREAGVAHAKNWHQRADEKAGKKNDPKLLQQKESEIEALKQRIQELEQAQGVDI